MARTYLPRTLGAVGIVAALVAALTLLTGSGLAAGSAAQANYAPANTAAPTISGTPQVGSTLTAGNGTWTSDTTPTFTEQWQSCDAQGNSCAVDLRRNGVDVHRGECGSREDHPRRRDRDQPVRLELGDVGTDGRRHPGRRIPARPAPRRAQSRRRTA